MSDIAIRVDGLGKQYRIGKSRPRYGSLRETLTESVSASFKRLTGNGNGHRQNRNTIWALKDVSFEVKRGEVMGVIGRNGAGKSTLLKVLSRITEPTTGGVDLYGRVGSLLEVGTGFHPELTGRENIFLNGAILGMGRREIESKFDEIVAFAEVEKFIDTPVKHYSSGMHMRLAFAVAAHLEPEILLVDEVLAVGDAAFQKKCLGKMGDVAKEGRTVLFVSHNMGAITHLCTSGLVLESGTDIFQGSANSAVEFYNHRVLHLDNNNNGNAPNVLYYARELAERHDFCVTKLEVLDVAGNPKPVVMTWDDVVFRIWYSCKKELRLGSVVLEIAGFEGSKLVLLSTQPDGTMPLSFETGEQWVDCHIETIPFSAGEYTVGAGLAIPNLEWLWRDSDLGRLTVLGRDVYGSGLTPAASRCLLAVRHHWRTSPL
jgi:lipopolysaccharide transport system ATP-binding protein